MQCANLSSGYEASSLVNSFHGIPHRDIDLNDSPDQFQLNLEYFEVCLRSHVSAYSRLVVCSVWVDRPAQRLPRREDAARETVVVASSFFVYAVASPKEGVTQ